MGDLTSGERNARDRKYIETICDVHRDIYHYLDKTELSEEQKLHIRERIEVAFKMAKSMNAKLQQYKHNYGDDWWNTAKKAWDWDELKKK